MPSVCLSIFGEHEQRSLKHKMFYLIMSLFYGNPNIYFVLVFYGRIIGLTKCSQLEYWIRYYFLSCTSNFDLRNRIVEIKFAYIKRSFENINLNEKTRIFGNLLTQNIKFSVRIMQLVNYVGYKL